MKINAKKQQESTFLSFLGWAAWFTAIVAGCGLLAALLPIEQAIAAQHKRPSSSSSPIQVGHLVKPGEHLHLLAAYYYGDARQWKRIYEANRHQIKNPNRISPDQIIRVNLPAGWSPPMSFSAWKEQVGHAPLPKQPSTLPAKKHKHPAKAAKPKKEKAPGEPSETH
jgi:hypothetical protein